MNSAHIHLVVTHLPIVGLFLGFPILLIGIIKKNLDLKFISYGIYIVCAISAGIAYITGEDAEEIVEELPGVSETLIEQHEHFATYSLTSIIILGIIVLLGIIVSKFYTRIEKTSTIIILTISFICFLLFARTGFLGGQIRHTEVRSGSSSQPTQNSELEEDDDD